MAEKKSVREQRREIGERFAKQRTGSVLLEEITFSTRQIARIFDDVWLHSARDMTQIKDALAGVRTEDDRITEVIKQLEATLNNARLGLERRISQTSKAIADAAMDNKVAVRNPIQATADIWHPACRRILDLFMLADKEMNQLQVLWLGEVLDDKQHSEKVSQLRMDLLTTLSSLTGIRNRLYSVRQAVGQPVAEDEAQANDDEGLSVAANEDAVLEAA